MNMSLIKKIFIVIAVLAFIGILLFIIDHTIRSIAKTKNKKLKAKGKEFEVRGVLNFDTDNSNFNVSGINDMNLSFETHKNYKYFKNKTCGPILFQSRIQAGEPAALNEFPWLVTFFAVNHTTKNYFCGGSLIGEKLILTAAHCLVSELKGFSM